MRLDGQAGLSAEVRNLLDGAPLDVRLTVRETELDVAVRVPAGAPALLRLGPAGQLDPGGLAGTHHVAWRLVALTSRALP